MMLVPHVKCYVVIGKKKMGAKTFQHTFSYMHFEC
jgi:hypothetical protein